MSFEISLFVQDFCCFITENNDCMMNDLSSIGKLFSHRKLDVIDNHATMLDSPSNVNGDGQTGIMNFHADLPNSAQVNGDLNGNENAALDRCVPMVTTPLPHVS